LLFHSEVTQYADYLLVPN